MEMLRKSDVPGAAARTVGPGEVPEGPPVYSTGAAAKICCVSQQTIIRFFDQGRIAGFKVPGSKFRRITREGLFKFMIDQGIPLDRLGELTETERAEVARKVMGPVKVAAPVNRVVGLTDSLTG